MLYPPAAGIRNVSRVLSEGPREPKDLVYTGGRPCFSFGNLLISFEGVGLHRQSGRWFRLELRLEVPVSWSGARRCSNLGVVPTGDEGSFPVEAGRCPGGVLGLSVDYALRVGAGRDRGAPDRGPTQVSVKDH